MTNRPVCAKIYTVQNLAELCKGSTADSDSVRLGSNPGSAAKTETAPYWVLFLFSLFLSEIFDKFLSLSGTVKSARTLVKLLFTGEILCICPEQPCIRNFPEARLVYHR